jgi:lipopolysaccharide transport system permease protein
MGTMAAFEDLRELVDYRELLWMWTLRGIKVRYKQSLFGFAWAIFQPLGLTAVFVLVFSYFVRLPSDGIPYPIFVYSAMLPWSFFSRSVIGGIHSLVGNMNLVKKIHFPRAVLPTAAIGVHFVDFICGLVVFLVLMVYYRIPPNPAMGMLPVLLLIQLLLTSGISLGASAVNVFYRDVYQMAPLLLQIWMYACPIIYPVSLIPDWLLPWYMINPMAVVIDAYRGVILKGQWPDVVLVGKAAVLSTVVFGLGYLTFKHLEDRFADVI